MPRGWPPTPRASAFWEVATPTYRKLAENWVMTAKQEATRDKRMAQLRRRLRRRPADPQPALRHRAQVGRAGRRAAQAAGDG